jgi:chromosome segregation protein
LKERYEHAGKNYKRIQNTREQHRLQLEQKEITLTDLSEKKRLTNEEQNHLEEQIGVFAKEREQIQTRLQTEEQVLTSIRENLESSEAQLRELRHRLNEISDRKQEIELKLTELRLKREHLRGSILHEYSIDLETLPLPEEIENPVDETQTARVQELKNKLTQMGPVNLMAIQEYKDLEERFQFLTQQEADLTQAMDTLRQVIQKINRTTSQLFNETFTKVNEKFGFVFSSFFEGGKAELVLVELENSSESGVEIHAQPPGKRLRNLTLLSGGEKALTAIALLFATFLIHPSPFCLLDEIDAPLDEENIRRFTKVLLQMINHSQFIVITHNKRTMEIAHALYGITMEEPGVSRLISVKLQEGSAPQGEVLEETPVNA